MNAGLGNAASGGSTRLVGATPECAARACPTSLVIAGAPGVLAKHVARLGAESGASVFSESGAFPPDADVWFFAGPSAGDYARLRGRAMRSFNHVTTPWPAQAPWSWIAGANPETPRVPALDEFPVVRVFTTSLTLSSEGDSREGFNHFLAALLELKTEIEERVSDYFDHRALRVRANPDAPINLLRVEDAAALLLSTAARAASGRWHLASPRTDAVAAVLERVGNAYGLSLLAEPNAEALNAIDTLFALRTGAIPEHANSAPAILSEAEPIEAFPVLPAAEQLPNAMERKQLDRLAYSSAGAGARTIVLLNAMGQALDFWSRLIAHLSRRHRILIAETRRGAGVAELAADLQAMLAAEQIAECELVAWCTGPRVAVEHVLERPESVRAMVFLNTTLKCPGAPAELCTAFEQSFEQLFHALEQRPEMAASIMRALRSSAGANAAKASMSELLDGDEEDDVAPLILAATNRALQDAVVAPFGTPQAVLDYGREFTELWRYDLRARAREVKTPILFVSAEHDRIAAPASSELGAALFPNARLLHVPGATHYFLFDRADLAAGLIEAFFEDPGPRP